MLQQTQAGRVVEKYTDFLKRFPDFRSLDKASVAEVISAWQGLGYNRRAIALKKIAATLGERWKHSLPQCTIEELDALPHIGHATACSISAFAWNARVSFIETNIRRVFIHFFFPAATSVSDTEIFKLVEATLPPELPSEKSGRDVRDWYYALMDYGSMLKGIVKNPNQQSAHYKRQSAFVGSNRQVRGEILKLLGAAGSAQKDITIAALTKKAIASIGTTSDIVRKNIQALAQEGFLEVMPKQRIRLRKKLS